MAKDSQLPENELLARLPDAEFQRVVARMRHVVLDFKQVLYEARSSIDEVYFITRGTASALTVLNDGNAIEVATIGKEGVVGLGALLASKVSPHRVIVQIAGEALRLSADALEQEARDDGPLRRLLLRYHTAFLSQVSQSVACNGLHPIQQRCCRWLLMTRDRIESDSMPITHEFLGIMLGVRRSSVTDVLRPLHEQGLIVNDRGTITIRDRQAIEELSCECYQTVKDDFDRLLGEPA